jgi:gamma-glutamyltranspeptidase / glutathione hydrolase
MRRELLALPLAALFSIAPAHSQQPSDTVAPETANSVQAKAPVHAKKQMVVAANPHAAEAGIEVLRSGGNAADALVAVQAMLGLVEPQSSGLGGGAFLLWYDAETGSITSFEGRETAPAVATPDLFLGPDHKPMAFFDAVVGGRSVGVPGVPRLLELAHKRYGKKPWQELFSTTIDLANNGFEVSPRLSQSITEDIGRLDRQPSTRAYFFDSAGAPLKPGTVLRNPTYAATLQEIAAHGTDAFYSGRIAQDIVAAVTGHPTNPGKLGLADLAGYQVKERPVVCVPYRGYQVCGMGPPSSGGLTIGQILGLIEPFDIATLGPDDPATWRIIGDATRLAFADRERYIADTDFVSMPAGLLDPNYLKARSELLRRPTAFGKDEVKAGEPPWQKAELRRDQPALEFPSTSHIVIVDADGNIASMTTSVENSFGARIMVDGFLLNNQLTDFAFDPGPPDAQVANRVQPGKRPRSSMAPTIVLKDGKPVYALGSPGGSMIIPFVANTLIALIDWKMDMQAAVSMPHLIDRFGPYDLEEGTWAPGLLDDLEALGYQANVKEINSGLNGVAIGPDGLTGGTDPRREGVAIGD